MKAGVITFISAAEIMLGLLGYLITGNAQSNIRFMLFGQKMVTNMIYSEFSLTFN